MSVRSNFSIRCLAILFFIANIHLSAQKNLYLLKKPNNSFHIIETGENNKYRISGYENVLKLKLMEVLDSGIVLKGYFSDSANAEKKEMFVPTGDIISINKVSNFETIAKAVGVCFILNGIASGDRSGYEKPPELESNVRTVMFFSMVAALPFLFQRNELTMGEKYILVIR